MIDPRSRQRVETVPVRSTVKRGVTNGELLSQFTRSAEGRLSPQVVEKYVSGIRDAFRYFHHDGHETPVSEWTKPGVWEYVHFMENNYCANLRSLPWAGEGAASCVKRVWIGALPAAQAAQEHCSGCTLFKRPDVRFRLHGLNKFYKYLARVGAVPVNFMQDVVSEHYEEAPKLPAGGERRRNPTVEEMLKLVNGTAHPARRAFYAASAKWWYRPNEMLMLDRYASFGLPTPEGVEPAAGFEDGFATHPKLAPFGQGGDLVYLPKTKGGTDKRKGNRWSVIDAELRPIIMQYLAWWDMSVKRDAEGRPVTTSLWLNESGLALLQKNMYPRFFTRDCERLGLQKKLEPDSRKRWTAHCQRHFGEQLRQIHNVPADWSNHFRGDAFKDARGHYYQPTPEHIRQKYHELVPLLGFQPLPDAARLRRGAQGEAAIHRGVIETELGRVLGLKQERMEGKCVVLAGAGEEYVVPHRVAPSVLFALRASHEGASFDVAPDNASEKARGRTIARQAYVRLLERARNWLA